MKLYILSFFIFVSLLCGNLIQAAPVPGHLKKTVTFIFIRDSSGTLTPIGTGFFVGILSKEHPELAYGFLVTAKHVLTTPQGRYYPEFFIRVNKRSGDSEIIRVSLSGSNAVRVYSHKDPQVDIAVIPIPPVAPNIYDVIFISDGLITTKERFTQMEITEGDEVFFIGLFTSFFGKERNYPIVRFGRVSIITDEKIPWNESGKPVEMLNLYLIESLSFGGNSGSPVFFFLSPTRDSDVLTLGPPRLFLAGIMRGYFNQHEEIEIRTLKASKQNLGISAVIPAYYLHEILFSDELVKLRSPATSSK